MKHKLKIVVSPDPVEGGVLSCRTVSLREKLLSRLLGPKAKMAVILPGNTVDRIAITEIPEGGEDNV